MVTFDERKIDALFADVDQCQLPGAAVGIAIGGRPVYRKGFGLASLELPTLLSPTIRMRIGSTSKQHTAFTFMMLCEAGLANIDDTLGKYLPELHPITHRVTMRQLMGNTSGLREANDLAAQFSGTDGRRVTSRDLMSFYRDVSDVSSEPGKTCSYNNGGWMLLGEVIERITGQTLEQVMWERVFEPIGMHDTLLRRWDAVFVPNSASTHTWIGDHFERRELIGGIDYAGAGSVASTVDDMLRWMANMDSPVVGSADTWAMMKRPQQLPNGTSTGYGLGLFILDHRGVMTIQHSGGGYGSNAQLLKVPEAGLDIIVMVNRSDKMSSEYANQIVAACLPDLGPEKPIRAGRAVTGIFRSPKTGRVIQLLAGEDGAVASIDGFDMPVEADEKGELRTVGAYSTWKYTVTPVGDASNPREIRFSHFGNIDTLTPVPAGKDEPRGIVGSYRFDETGSDAVIWFEGDAAVMQVRGRFGNSVHQLQRLAPGIWRSTPVDELVVPRSAVLVFDADGTGFQFSNCLNWNLRFKRVA